MRRLLLPLLSATLLVSADSAPARAEDGLKEYYDCLAFTMRWCKLAREDANFLEEMAVDFLCSVKMAACVTEAF